MKKIYDMTKGKIWTIILSFSLPLLGASLIQQLYNTADMIFVGNFVGKEATGAVGASSLLFTCIIGLFTGVSIGVGVAVSQKIGSKDLEIASKVSHTAITFGIIGGIILTLVGFFSAEFLLTLMNTPKEIMYDSVIYLKIYFLSMLPMILYNIGSGIIRSTGNSKTPFYILIIGGLTNVLANYIFIVVFKMGVSGVAIATTLSQTLTAIIVLTYLFKNKTVITIAHKLNTIKNYDQIIVMSDGIIEEKGTHEELMKNRKRYYEMYTEMKKAQSNEYSLI